MALMIRATARIVKDELDVYKFKTPAALKVQRLLAGDKDPHPSLRMKLVVEHKLFACQ
jgi:hypothetical protein